MNASSSSRYSSWYCSGSQSSVISATSRSAIFSSRSEIRTIFSVAGHAEPGGLAQLGGVAEHVQHQDPVVHHHRGEMLARLHHHRGHRDLAAAPQGLAEQRVAALAAAGGLEVVRPIEVERRDRGRFHEGEDVDALGALGARPPQVGVADDDVAPVRLLHAPHDPIARHRLAGALADLLVPDRRAVPLVEQREVQIVALLGGHQGHRDVDEAEADAAGPDRRGHAGSDQPAATAARPGGAGSSHQVGPRRPHPHPGEHVEDPAGTPQITPRHPGQTRDPEALGMRLQDSPREARPGHQARRLPAPPPLPAPSRARPEAGEAAAHLGQRARAELQQRSRARDRDGGVPQAAGGETRLRRDPRTASPRTGAPSRRRRCRPSMGAPGSIQPYSLSGDVGWAAQQHHAVGMPVDRARPPPGRGP